ncbi:MAG TPA: TonB family protein [Myxococcota bacterium]|nr:TonB family protein [Myxococcota bacterium]
MAINFGKYQLMRRLAVGGMAEVFLAVVRGEGGFAKHVAIKRILPHLSCENEFISMFLDEARILARFNHPNIVQIFDLGRVNNAYFLAMEFVHGLTMFKIFNLCARKKQRLPLEISAKIVSDTCDALDYAHNFAGADGTPLDLVHRDVSSQNIMLSVDGVVKVLDFGIAKAVGNLSRTRPTWLKGKAMYMSPEQIEMRGNIDRRSDIFSLGTLLYLFVTQRRPFRGETEYQVMMSIVNQEAPDPREHNVHIPAEMAAIINRALKKERDQRYQSARELREDLERFLFKRGRRVDGYVLADFLAKLAPRKKKTTGRAQRVPTRPFTSRLDTAQARQAVREVFPSQEQPLVLRHKKSSQPIVLRTKKDAAPAPPQAVFSPEEPPRPATPVAVRPAEPVLSLTSLAPNPEPEPPGERPFAAISRRKKSLPRILIFLLLLSGGTFAVLYFAFPSGSGKRSAARSTGGVKDGPATTAKKAVIKDEQSVEKIVQPVKVLPKESATVKSTTVMAPVRKRRSPITVNWSAPKYAEPSVEVINSDKAESPVAKPAPVAPEVTPVRRVPAGKPPVEEPPDAGKPPGPEPGMQAGEKIAAVKPLPPLVNAAPPAGGASKKAHKAVFQRFGELRKRRVSGADPVYPRIARQAKIEATLVVRLEITPLGRVKSFRFLKTQEAFEKGVTDAIKSWRFSPYLVTGKAVATYTVYKFVFKLR